MTVRWEILVGAIVIATSILFVGRYQISAIGFGYAIESNPDNDTEAVYRLDRWTGKIDYCLGTGFTPDRSLDVVCPARVPEPRRPPSN